MSKQKIYFCTYGNSLYTNAKKRIINEAKNTNWFDSITCYGPEMLSKDFKNKFNTILCKKIGAGYWIWKFDILLQELNKMQDNDILIYLDSGCSINSNAKTRYLQYIDMLNNSDESMISFQLSHQEKKYSIQEIGKLLEIDSTDKVFDTGQLVGGVLIMKKHDKTKYILNKCIELLTKDKLIITDEYNKKNQLESFIDNRHDQSILSLVRKKYGSIILQDETWFKDFGSKESLEFPFWATRIRK